MNRLKHLLALCLLLIGLASVKAQPLATEDALLPLLQQQIDSIYRAFPKSAEVYFLSYRVEKSDQYFMSASIGSLTNQEHVQQAQLTIQIRVGNTDIDNYYSHYQNVESFNHTHSIAIPLDDNPMVISKILARETALAYQEARIEYAKALTSSKDIYTAQQSFGDYTLMQPTYYYESPVKHFSFPEDKMLEKLTTCTGALNTNVEMLSSADLLFTIKRNYFVSSEKSAAVENHVQTHLVLALTGKASDGTPLVLSKQYDAEYPDELPADEELVREMQDMEPVMAQMIHSTVAEEGLYPVIFADEAAAMLWQSALLPYLVDYQGSFGNRLLPEDITVVSDPTHLRFADCKLSGTYHCDDEGVVAEPVALIENGFLSNAFYSSESSRRLHQSNGHGRARAGNQPTPVPANLLVTTTRPHSEQQLRSMLQLQLSQAGCPFGYWVGSAVFDKDGSICPMYMKKIYADGRPDEVVHGVKFTATPRQLLSQVIGMGDVSNCAQEMLRGVSYHICSPAVLVGQIEVLKNDEGRMSLPMSTFVYDGGQEVNQESLTDVIFQAMEEEITTVSTQLSSKNDFPPYYLSFLVTDARLCGAKSTLGSLISHYDKPFRDVETQVLVGSNVNNSGRLPVEARSHTDFPLDNNYNNIRRCLNGEADKAYKRAVGQMAEKTQMRHLLGDTLLDEKALDRVPAWITNVTRFSYDMDDAATLRLWSEVLSLQFAPYSKLQHSSVELDAFYGNAFFSGSDGVQYAQPLSLLRVRISADILDKYGRTLSDCKDLYFHNLQEVGDVASLYKYIVEMAERLMLYQTAPSFEDNVYSGPVLVKGDAAAWVFAYAFTQATPNIIASPTPLKIGSSMEYFKKEASSLSNMIDKKIIHRSVDVDALNTKRMYESQYLIGSFDVDADGIKSEDKREIIRNGELNTLLTNRMATAGQEESNGHLRLALCDGRIVAVAGAGVLELSCSRTQEEAQMIKTMCKQAKTQGFKYAYIINNLAIRDGIIEHVYAERVNVNTHKAEPILLSPNMEIELSMFAGLSATSKHKSAYNMLIGGGVEGSCAQESPLNGVPCSFIVPDVLQFNRFNLLKINNK